MKIRWSLSSCILPFLPLLAFGVSCSPAKKSSHDLSDVSIKNLAIEGYDRYEIELKSDDPSFTFPVKKFPRGPAEVGIKIPAGTYTIRLDYFLKDQLVISAGFCQGTFNNTKQIFAPGPVTVSINVCKKEGSPSAGGDFASKLAKTCQAKGTNTNFCSDQTLQAFSGYSANKQSTCSLANRSSRFPTADHTAVDDKSFYAEVKKFVWSLMYDLNFSATSDTGFSECRADLAVAAFMQETSGIPRVGSDGNLPYDAKKDGATDGSQNVSIFNMNINFIQISCEARRSGSSASSCGAFAKNAWGNTGSKKYLNKLGSLPEAVRRFSEGMDHFGVEGALYFHRGGYSGWKQTSSDEKDFANAILSAGNRMRGQEGRFSDKRFAHSIPYRGPK